jgi:hypothetical protein
MITAHASFSIYCTVFNKNEKVFKPSLRTKQIETNQRKMLQLYDNKMNLQKKLDKQIYNAIMCSSSQCCFDLWSEVNETLYEINEINEKTHLCKLFEETSN